MVKPLRALYSTQACRSTKFGLRSQAGSKDVCILCHGLGASRNSCFLPEVSEALAAKKISSFRFDFNGNGNSEGSFKYGNYSAEMEDVRAAALKLRSLGYGVVGLLGHSKAGTVVMKYTAKYGDIPRVVNVSGRFAQDTGLDERFGKDIIGRLRQEKSIPMKAGKRWRQDWTLHMEDLQERLDTNMGKECSQIGPRTKILTIHGDLDESVDVSNARQYATFIANSQLEIVEGADHTFSQPQHRQRLLTMVADFLQTPVDQALL